MSEKRETNKSSSSFSNFKRSRSKAIASSTKSHRLNNNVSSSMNAFHLQSNKENMSNNNNK